ncbi:cell envelope integrity protein TolA [Paraburkholderia phosphatilytica]|uniref:cell envelope integrity protein TolA n=1 Tax=Paraburkholderia phosphatilytica TaxID=2282883 RepID=UPI000F60209C|nr:cell envelope integrity protein TolA [Paraburkholderia phosphatilytica]
MSSVPAEAANPTVVAETAAETGWWSAASGWIHGGLDALGAIPEVGAVFDGANALVYTAEGNMVQAGISGGAAVLDLVPVAGTAGKVAEFGIKGAAKLAAKETAEDAAKLEAKQLAEQEAKKLAEQEAKKQAEKDAEKAAEEDASKPPTDKDGGKVKGGPCDHLKQGSGKGPYRGGAHSKTSKPANDGKDSHHMPADDASPLPKKDGPAIQMDPADHHQTSSNGRNGTEGAEYREMIANLLKDGKWREAMSIEIQDVREIAKAIGDPRKYNEAMLEMLEYFKCLEKNNLLPMG